MVKFEVLNTSLQWCKMCAYMRTICSKTCAIMCKKITYLVFVANVANLRYLPVHCAKGPEFASFAVHFWSSVD